MDGYKKEEGEQQTRPRTSEDFYLFCTYVLEHENYDAQNNENLRDNINHSPPLDSSRSSVNSESNSDSVSLDHDYTKESDADDETEEGSDSHGSDDLVTCYCQKPFAGRPMIECSRCLTWIHLSCARIKKTNIPDVFHCAMCKGEDERKREASPLMFTNKRHKKTS